MSVIKNAVNSYNNKNNENDSSCIFTEGRNEDLYVGKPFYINYEEAHVLISDSYKAKVKGIPQGAFLLAFYDNEKEVKEALLLRALDPVNLPTHSDVLSSMVEYYKDDIETTGEKTQLDAFTRYEFSFSGLRCRILGTFYENEEGRTEFGADVENFYSAHYYKVYKATSSVLEKIANLRDGETTTKNEVRIGEVRYSSSRRQGTGEKTAEVRISPVDFLGKRTALFGMTRTGKSNTVKKIIEATMGLSAKAQTKKLGNKSINDFKEMSAIVSDKNVPRYPVGQIIFDVNGEYANANLQDEGTAIFQKFEEQTVRYSVVDKPGFQVLKTNFYAEVQEGFGLISSLLSSESQSDYIKNFLNIDIIEPDKNDFSKHKRWERIKAAYLCCLYKAGFVPPEDFKVYFSSSKDIQKAMLGKDDSNGSKKSSSTKNTDQKSKRTKKATGISEAIAKKNPKNGLTLDEATNWFEWIANNQEHNVFKKYKEKKHHGWVDGSLNAVLVMLTRKKNAHSSGFLTGYNKFTPFKPFHTSVDQKNYSVDISSRLSNGEIVIVDLSQGDPVVQQLYSEKICSHIFHNAMGRFTESKPNNFIQFYFEEAHNLFPKKDDQDLKQIYNRIAKEGAKLNLGLIYATQEVSSISSNILKNTQNWFIAHLNNEDELKEIRKFYDFSDFTESLTRFSAGTDKGFVRMKTYSNPFVVPVQIDKFTSIS